MLKSLSARVVLALILGLLAGAWVRETGNAPLQEVAHLVQALGNLWLNALQMTVVPLVFALVVVGIASVADAVSTGRLAARAVILFTFLIACASIFGIAGANGLLALWPITSSDTAGLLGRIASGAPATVVGPDFAAWIQSLAPSNVIAAAAKPDMLQLVVFAVFFGFAATRLAPNLRDPLVTFFKAVSETVVVVVEWILLAGPIGVFGLSLGVGLAAGLDVAGGLLHYIVIVTVLTAIATPIALVLAVLWGKIPLRTFLKAATPVWAIAFSTQSSLASLPAMLEAARRTLQIPERVMDLVLPLAVAVFRFTSPIANLAVCVFIAHLYNVHPTVFQYAGAAFVAFVVSVGSVGLPGQVSYVASIGPICLALGLPIDLLGIFLAVEVIPDIFRTLGNVTGDLAATTILNRAEKPSSVIPGEA